MSREDGGPAGRIDLAASGYARISNRYTMVARIDRPDWKDVMASAHTRGHAWVASMGDRDAADHYRRCFSKDKIEGLPRSAYSKLPASSEGPRAFMAKTMLAARKEETRWT